MLKSKTKGSIVLRAFLTCISVFLIYWFTLPPINLRSNDFWSFFIVSGLIVYFLNFFAFTREKKVELGRGKNVHLDISLDKTTLTAILVAVGILLLSVIATIVGSPLFFSGRYKDLIDKQNGDFTADISELSMSQIPVVDRDSASRLGLRKLGEMSDLVSQFEVTEDYVQINYRGTPYRVTPLAYGDIFKWLNNHTDGIPAYITVDMTTQETSLVRLEEGIRYSESEYFMRNINRYLRFGYPTKIFEDVHMEIDDNGTPFWIAPTVTYRVALWSGRDISGAVLVNAVTGESAYYDLESIPAWVDQVFVSELVIEQLNYNGKYQQGFFNSLFGQKGVLQTTEGYNYITVGDDVCLYTGMTSVASDQSNVGFVLVNLRTKETRYYSVPGAEEYSAMDSAEGQVQNLKYEATFPILLNVAERPTYFMSLKDDAGLVKMYAFVDVQRYQLVGTGATVQEARANYIKKLESDGETVPGGTQDEEKTVSGAIASISPVVISGNTVYYFTLEGDSRVYSASLSVSPLLPFVSPGDAVELTYADSSEEPIPVTGFKKK